MPLNLFAYFVRRYSNVCMKDYNLAPTIISIITVSRPLMCHPCALNILIALRVRPMWFVLFAQSKDNVLPSF